MRRRATVLAVLVAAGCQSPGAGSPATVALEIPFVPGSWGFAAGAGPTLDAAANALGDSRLAGARYLLRAYAPAGGAPGEAVALSRLRASAVLDQLAARGVARGRLEAQGMGADSVGERIEIVRR